jgi:hypothetical protein
MSYKRQEIDAFKINDLAMAVRIVKRESSMRDELAAAQQSSFRIMESPFQPAKRSQRP